MNDPKESNLGHLSCKIQSARTEKDLYRICPSKLNKRELEDLYFTLLEQNLKFKKTINEQQDQIKILNTKVQRMTVQKPVVGFHNRDCCAGSKAIINEQKESIANLKKANERLSERLRLLNMRLCSAKQFLRRGTSQTTSHCSKCVVSSASIRNSSASALNNKRSETKLRIDSSSDQYQMEKDNIPIRLTEIDIPTEMVEATGTIEIPVGQAPCERRECRTEIEDLKMKIVALEEEVCAVRRSHSGRMAALEAEAARAVTAHKNVQRLAEELRGSRRRADELLTELQLQHARVCEQRTQRADDRVNGRLDQAAACINNRTLPLSDVSETEPSVTVPSVWEYCPPIVVPNNSGTSLNVKEKCLKNFDDSGFTDYKNQDLEEEKDGDDRMANQITNLKYPVTSPVTSPVISQAEPLGAESSISHDIFSTSRIKTLKDLNKGPSTSEEPDVLLSTERINVGPTQASQKFEQDFKYTMPGPLGLDMPKMPLGDIGTDIQTDKNEPITKYYEGNRSVKINSDKVKQIKQGVVDEGKNTMLDGIDKSNQIIQGLIEEGKTNNSLKKNRRSSFKLSNDRKQSRDLGVRYEKTQTDIDKVFIAPDDERVSDPSVQYKVNDKVSMRRIRYMTDVQTDPYMETCQKSPPNDNGAQRDGTDRVNNDVAIQCLKDLTSDGSCDDKRLKETITNINMNNTGPCVALSGVCACSSSPATCCHACACAQRPLRPASPDRTECDLSSLTDLTHTDDASPSNYMSPGEEKASSSATADGGHLSEGEVPTTGGKILSTTMDKMTEPVWSSRSDKMEETLRAIGEELTRCRELLQRRGEERASEASSLALRHAEGSWRLRESSSPKCIFTLHVGTAVLADQAAACVDGRSLLACWRFYQQPAGATRALRGRIINYDCTTHYDINITGHFLCYLKQEMPIIISEVDKQNEAFAMCSLPLRDALLHPNRRVDMSLALVQAGGRQEEEAGVLDVWFSLRVDAAALPLIHTAIVRPSSLKSRHHSSSILEQILDEDQSVEYRYSKDLQWRRSKEDVKSDNTPPNLASNSESPDKVPELRHSFKEVIENEVPVNIRSIQDFKQAIAKTSNDATNIYDMLKNKKWNRRSTLGSQKTQEAGRQKSVTISNQPFCSRKISRTSDKSEEENLQSIDITILWLALNEDCSAMSDSSVQRLYVAYSFLGGSGADLETPVSLPKPKHYMDKCHFLFKKSFRVSESDTPTLGRLARCLPPAGPPDPSRAVVFSVVSEPVDDPLGLNSCKDVGYAYLYLGEVLSLSVGPSFTAVLEVLDPSGVGCGALAVKLDGLDLLRRCKELASAAQL